MSKRARDDRAMVMKLESFGVDGDGPTPSRQVRQPRSELLSPVERSVLVGSHAALSIVPVPVSFHFTRGRTRTWTNEAAEPATLPGL